MLIFRNEKCTTKHILPEQSLHGTLSDDFPWQMPPFASTVIFVRVLVLVPVPHFEEQLPIFLQADQTQLTSKRWNDWINYGVECYDHIKWLYSLSSLLSCITWNANCCCFYWCWCKNRGWCGRRSFCWNRWRFCWF